MVGLIFVCQALQRLLFKNPLENALRVRDFVLFWNHDPLESLTRTVVCTRLVLVLGLRGCLEKMGKHPVPHPRSLSISKVGRISKVAVFCALPQSMR